MSFEIWEEEQYRSASLEDLNLRYAAIGEELVNAESTFSYEELEADATRCKDSINRMERAAEIKKETRAKVAAGAGAVVETNSIEEREAVNVYETRSYENAFMNYIQNGTAMPTEYRTDDKGTIINTPTVTTGVPPQVPSTMQKEIISKMEEYGNIWNIVRKISVQGGIWFRILDLNPTATWLQKGSGKTELSVSGYQGVTNDATISFSFYELECRMSQSLLAAATTYADFQALFVPAVAKAMVKALEAAIMKGDGNGQFKGICTDTRITNVAQFSTANISDWKAWHTDVDAAILPEYDNGGFIMAKSTWNKYIDTMADNQNAPIAEFHYDPVSGKRVNTLMGKPVMLVSTDILPDFGTASVGDVFAIYGDMSNYVVNTQPGMPLSTVRWIDHETNTEKIKSLMAADGKVLDPYGFMLIKKKAVG